MNDDRCWCCDSMLTTRGACPVCDMAGLMSPPHVCVRSFRTIGDEHGCEPSFAALAPDHETGRDFAGLRRFLQFGDLAA